jgi:hypothetical protein
MSDRTYIIGHEAWYHKVPGNPAERPYVTVSGEWGEFQIVWYTFTQPASDIGKPACPQVTLFDDSWRAFKLLPQFFGWLADNADTRPSVMAVRAMLDYLGLVDATERDNPLSDSAAAALRDQFESTVSAIGRQVPGGRRPGRRPAQLVRRCPRPRSGPAVSAAMRIIQSLDHSASIGYSSYTDGWYVKSNIEISDGHSLTSETFHEATPDEAVAVYLLGLQKVELGGTRYVIARPAGERIAYQWNGAAFTVVTQTPP